KKTTMHKIILYLLLQLVSTKILAQETKEQRKKRQDAIVQEYIYECSVKNNYYHFMQEYQACIDAGIKKDSTIAYLWQQKAMPYFKIKKYEVGMKYVDKAVYYDSSSWLSYRAFIKCIFARRYKEAIIDFEECIKRFGNSYVQDHSFSFYIGLSYLQLNEFKKAESVFAKDIEAQTKRMGDAHYLDLFYFGITKLEQQKWEEAIVEFDKSLKQYPQFSDVLYHKAKALIKLNKKEEAKEILIKSKEYYDKGFSINESNAVYETYPYKAKWD
ncbi:MAG: tetratricopeptide repeat protein, partial [Flavobacterium sp.]